MINQVTKELSAFLYFPAIVYTIEMPDFLPIVKEVCLEYITEHKEINPKLNEIYPVRMTSSFHDEPRLNNFSQQILEMAWSVLKDQGYSMDNFETFFTEMWCQEHHKHSLMEQHVHMFGAQIVGFYFLETPKNCSRVMFHDPKAGKVQINLPEENIDNATAASTAVNFEPKPGLVIFSNSWLPHSFSRHASNKPFKFIHFNISVRPKYQHCCPAAEII